MIDTFELRIRGGDGGRFPNVFITSDTHYNHKNICHGTTNWRTKDGQKPTKSTRDFVTVEDMNETIINGINKTVGQEDILILAGDVAFQGADSVHKFLDRIVCQNLYLVFGNHDKEILENEMGLRSRFKDVFSYMRLSIGGTHRFIIQHYPIVSWHGLNKGTMHLFGHVHLPPSKRFGPGRCMDIGFDGHPESRPYHIMNECVPLLEKREIRSWFTDDHHTEEIRRKK